MITIRTTQLTNNEIDELLRIFVIAKSQLCKDTYPSDCNNCEFSRLCKNMAYNITYLHSVQGKKKR